MIRFLPACALVILLAACASTAVPASGPTTGATRAAPATVTLTRSGGLTGSAESVVIAPSGTWTRTDRTGARASGLLTAAELDELHTLADRLTAVTAPSMGTVACADGSNYAVTVAAVTVSYTDCTSPKPPVATEIFAAAAAWKIL